MRSNNDGHPKAVREPTALSEAEWREILLAIREGNIVQNRAIERLLGLKPSTPPKNRGENC